jgi:hypothetical protein
LPLALLALAAPGRQMGRVEPLAAEQRADGASISAGFCLVQNEALVLGSELAAFGVGRDLRVREGRRTVGGGVGNSSASGGLATLALPALRSCRLRLCGPQLLEIRFEHGT